MEYIRLGKTDLLTSRIAFGGMRLHEAESEESAFTLVRKAYEAGINFYDTSSKTPVSEKLLGDSLFDYRRNVFLSTSTRAKTCEEIKQNLEDSLMTLHCDYVDLYQFETEKFLPEPGRADGIYDFLLEAKKEGKIKHFGLITTNYETARKALESDLYETLQYPFSIVSPESTFELVKLCEEHDVGFIAMQPLGGGIIDNIPLALGFLRQFENVIPIWGVKSQEQIDQILYFNEHPPLVDESFQQDVEKIRNFFN